MFHNIKNARFLGVNQLSLYIMFNNRLSNEPSHIKDVKNGSGPCLHGTQDEVGTTKHNWSAWFQYNVTGWVSMWAYDMLLQCGSTLKRALSPTATNRHLISLILSPPPAA